MVFRLGMPLETLEHGAPDYAGVQARRERLGTSPRWFGRKASELFCQTPVRRSGIGCQLIIYRTAS